MNESSQLVRITREELFELYKLEINEYHFVIRLNWERQKYFIVLNAAILGLATGLLRLRGEPEARLFVAAIFVSGICTSLLGIYLTKKGHEYFRRGNYKKIVIEDCLGLLNPVCGYAGRQITLDVSTPTADLEKKRRILSDPELWITGPIRFGRAVFYIRCVLILFLLLDAFGVMYIWLPSVQEPAKRVIEFLFRLTF